MCWGRTVLVPEALGHQVFVLPGILCQKGCLVGDVLEKRASEALLKTFASVPNCQMAPIDLQLGVQLVVSTIHFRFSGLRGAMRCAFSGAAAAETRGAGRLRGRGGLGVGFTFGCSSSQLLLELEPRFAPSAQHPRILPKSRANPAMMNGALHVLTGIGLSFLCRLRQHLHRCRGLVFAWPIVSASTGRTESLCFQMLTPAISLGDFLGAA